VSTGSRQHWGQRRAFRTLVCAISGGALALLLAAVGCQSEDIDPDTGLNPRPEELPSASAVPGGAPSTPEPVAPPRETCEDNSLLAGCEAPGDEQAVDSDDAPTNLNADGQDAGADPSGLDVDAGALTASDAGTP